MEAKKRRAKQAWAWASTGLAGLVAAVIFFPLGTLIGGKIALIPPKVIPSPPRLNIIAQDHPSDDDLDLGKLLSLKPNQLEGVDIVVLDLACSQGLPGCENLDIPAARRTLDTWADHVREEIIRNHHQFTDNPASYYNSESYFDALFMICVVQQDMGIHYNLERMKDWSLSHGEDVFINGLIGDLREGTCSSMPVLYVAIGRRLGWPMYLVSAKGHFFARWESDDGKVRFNIEGTNHGMGASPDEYYKKWPYLMTEDDQWSGVYLRSMSGAEMLACFLEMRGAVLESVGKMAEAQVAYAHANEIIPQDLGYFFNLATASEKERMMGTGLLDPNNPLNPYRGKEPPPYVNSPPKDAFPDTVYDVEASK